MTGNTRTYLVGVITGFLVALLIYTPVLSWWVWTKGAEVGKALTKYEECVIIRDTAEFRLMLSERKVGELQYALDSRDR